MLAYLLIHSAAGPIGLVINLIVYLIIAVILFMVIKWAAAEFGVPQSIVKLLGLLFFLLLILTLFVGCESIGSVGVHGSFENENGQTFSGGVDVDLRDSKTVKPLRH